jgi:hypothetical protein
VIWYIHVGVALARPPRLDEYRRYAIEADCPYEAEELALQMASHDSVMPVWSKVVGDEEFPDPDHHRGWDTCDAG